MGECGSVLSGPYSYIPGTPIPLATLGLVAYSTVAFLAVTPLLLEQHTEDDFDNRVTLTAVATAMGVFSVGLMVILFGVLKETCVYCIGSAVLSVSLAKLTWLGGALPKERARTGIWASTGTSLVAAVAAALLFVATDASSPQPVLLASTGSATPSTLLTGSSSSFQSTGQSPPPIESASTPRALEIASQLQALDTRFYGAYWCSHCYEQKEALGKEAMARIPYIECSKEGKNPQTQLCKEKKIPGYPTWEIAGKLYPGEQALEELEDIIRDSVSRTNR